MNCDEVRELTAAYALRALEPDEQRAVEAHLLECDLHEDVGRLRAAALSLSVTVPELEPPAGLREQVLRRVAAEPSRAPPERLGTRRSAQVGAWAPYALAASLAVLAAGLGVWVLVLLGDDGGGAVVRDVSQGTIEAHLVYLPEDGKASLTVSGLKELGAEQTYQLWVIRGGEAVSIRLLVASAAGTAGATFEHELRPGDIVALTIEPAGGSPQPTSDPIFAAEI